MYSFYTGIDGILSRSLVFQISSASQYLPGNVSSNYLFVIHHLETRLFRITGNLSKLALLLVGTVCLYPQSVT